MRFTRNIVFGIVILIVVFLAGAYALPQQVSVSRDIVINAPASKVFPHINDLRKFQAWSPWGSIDSEMKLVFSGAEKGKGQIAAWSSSNPDVGTGSQEITESVPDKRVATRLDFGEMGTATASWDLSAQANGTRVVWSFQTDLGTNPLMRWMGLLFDRWIGKQYEQGLQDLKGIVEKQR